MGGYKVGEVVSKFVIDELKFCFEVENFIEEY